MIQLWWRDFRAYANLKGWQLTESENVDPPGQMMLGRSRIIQNSDGEEELVVIPKALVYEKRAKNNGGLSVAFGPATSRS